jgi:hypothetical protein
MYISLKDSCTKGFNKWDARQREIKKEVLAAGSDEGMAADLGLDNRSKISPKRPHHLALIPGPGTL